MTRSYCLSLKKMNAPSATGSRALTMILTGQLEFLSIANNSTHLVIIKQQRPSSASDESCAAIVVGVCASSSRQSLSRWQNVLFQSFPLNRFTVKPMFSVGNLSIHVPLEISTDLLHATNEDSHACFTRNPQSTTSLYS